RFAILERHKRNLVSRTRRPVPRTMLRDECAAPIAFRELLSGVERELQRCNMRSQQHIRNDGSRYKLGTLLFHAAVDVTADVAVWPSVESVIFQRREVIRGKIIAETVEFVHWCPDFPC